MLPPAWRAVTAGAASHVASVSFAPPCAQFFGNSNENTKALFQERLQTPMTPTFSYWRNGGSCI